MGAMASQITSLTIIYSIVQSGTDQRKHQSSASLAAQMASDTENVSIWWRHHVSLRNNSIARKGRLQRCDPHQTSRTHTHPDSKVYGANMGPNWGRQDPGGPRVGRMYLAILEDNLLVPTFISSVCESLVTNVKMLFLICSCVHFKY